jgi:hypothetical protein
MEALVRNEVTSDSDHERRIKHGHDDQIITTEHALPCREKDRHGGEQ